MYREINKDIFEYTKIIIEEESIEKHFMMSFQ